MHRNSGAGLHAGNGKGIDILFVIVFVFREGVFAAGDVKPVQEAGGS